MKKKKNLFIIDTYSKTTARQHNVMIDDLGELLWRPRPGIHAVISDCKDTYRALDGWREERKITLIFPERQIEQIRKEVWPLESFWA